MPLLSLQRCLNKYDYRRTWKVHGIFPGRPRKELELGLDMKRLIRPTVQFCHLLYIARVCNRQTNNNPLAVFVIFNPVFAPTQRKTLYRHLPTSPSNITYPKFLIPGPASSSQRQTLQTPHQNARPVQKSPPRTCQRRRVTGAIPCFSKEGYLSVVRLPVF